MLWNTSTCVMHVSPFVYIMYICVCPFECMCPVPCVCVHG